MVVQQRFGGGETGDDVARRQRREALRKMDTHLEDRLRPIRNLMTQLRGVSPPDYGTLDVRSLFPCPKLGIGCCILVWSSSLGTPDEEGSGVTKMDGSSALWQGRGC